MSIKLHSYLALALACTSTLAINLANAEVPAERAVKYRQSAYYLMGQHLSQINAVVKGDVPYNKAAIEINAETLNILSKIVFEAFPAGSDGGASKAKAEIWKEMEKFKQMSQAAQGEAAKLDAAAKSGDLAQIKLRFNDLSKSCKVCHDQYKQK